MSAEQGHRADDARPQRDSPQLIYAAQTLAALAAMVIVLVSPLVLRGMSTPAARATAIGLLVGVAVVLGIVRRPRATEFAIVVGSAAVACAAIVLWIEV